MNYAHAKGFKFISVFVLSVFLWTFGGLHDIVYGATHAPAIGNAKKAATGDTAKKLQDSIEGLEKTLADKRSDWKARTKDLKGQWNEIQDHDKEIRKEFADTERRLKKAGLPKEILDRHHEFVEKYERNWRQLDEGLRQTSEAESETAYAEEANKLRTFFEKTRPPSKHNQLDPNRLPNRTAKPVKKKPRLKKEEFEKEPAPTKSSMVTPEASWFSSALSFLSGVTPALAEEPPSGDEYLGETIEVQFTQAIQDKAMELDHNPVKIYNWVRNNIHFVPSWGSLQDADHCLLTRQGDATDIATLLIALLRVSNIPARYVQGTIELSIENFMNWVGGFSDAQAALDFAASGDIPVNGLVSDGRIVAVQMEHVWVEAWIDYLPSRGSRHKDEEGDTWVRLDGSYKQYNLHQPLDLQSAVPFDAEAFYSHVVELATLNDDPAYVLSLDSPYIDQTITEYRDQILAYISENHPGSAARDILGGKEIVEEDFPHLLGTLPYRPIVTGEKFTQVQNNLRHQVRIELLSDGLNQTTGTHIDHAMPTSGLSGKKVSLNYAPYTDADRELIEQHVLENAASLPAYMIRVQPELRIEDEIVAIGQDVALGEIQELRLSFVGPFRTETEIFPVTAGDSLVLGIDIGGAKKTHESRVGAPHFENPVSEVLYHIILGYWAEYDSLKMTYANAHRVAWARSPSVGVSSAAIDIDYLFGVPYRGSYKELGLDIRRDVTFVSPRDGDKSRLINFNYLSGMAGSLLEGSIFDQLFEYQKSKGISAARIIKTANSEGIPIYHLDENNYQEVVPSLQVPETVKQDIANAIGMGKEVIVPERSISLDGWTGCGYVVKEQENGTGGWIIEGGTAGGLYMLAASTCAATIEYPENLGIVESIAAWESSLSVATTVQIETNIGLSIAETIGGIAIGELVGWAVLIVLMLIIIIALILDVITDNTQDRNYERFWHYTSEVGVAGIISTRKIWITWGGDLGDGVYVTDLQRDPSDLLQRDEICRAINYKPYEECMIVKTRYVELLIDQVRRPLLPGDKDREELKHQFMWPAVWGMLKIDGEDVVLVGTDRD